MITVACFSAKLKKNCVSATSRDGSLAWDFRKEENKEVLKKYRLNRGDKKTVPMRAAFSTSTILHKICSEVSNLNLMQ